MEIYLVRHGQSENNALMEDPERRVEDPSLTKAGFQQAHLVAQFLTDHPNLEEMVRHQLETEERQQGEFNPQVTHIYCSPMRRALQTAQPIGKHFKLDPAVCVDIHEIGGIFLEKEGVVTGLPGMTRDEILSEFPNYHLPDAITETGWWPAEKGREDVADTLARCIRVAMELRRRAQAEPTQDDKIILVAHGMFIDGLIKAFLHNIPTDRYFHWHYNTGVTRIDLIEDGVALVRYINRVTHLPPELVTS
jgi:2,3-bisphosphoglycerate-dependent phosphoglycerate mutase